MPKEDNKVLKHNQGEKSMKVANTTCADLEYMSTCYNNPKKSSTTKINKHAASGYSLFTYCSSNTRKNKLGCYSGKDCMKRFSKDLKKHSTKIINYEKKEMVPLTNEEKRLHCKQKVCCICKKEFSANDKKYQKVRDHYHYTGR